VADLSLDLSSLVNGSTADADPLRTAFQAIQAAFNGLNDISWTALALAGGGTLHYAKDAFGFVHFRNEPLGFTSNVTQGTTLATLPAGFRPGTGIVAFFPLWLQQTGSTSPQTPVSVTLDSGGVLKHAAGSTIFSAGVYYLGASAFLAEN